MPLRRWSWISGVFSGNGLTEMTAGTKFPPIGELPYLLTLPAYGFYWFRIEKVGDDVKQASPYLPELFTLVATGRLESIFAGRELTAFEQTAAPSYLQTRRWFAHKAARVSKVHLEDYAMLRDGPRGRYILPVVSVAVSRNEDQKYFMPLAVKRDVEDDEALLPFAVSRLRRGARIGLLYDADASPDFADAMLGAMRRSDVLETMAGARFALFRRRSSPTSRTSMSIASAVWEPSRAIRRSTSMIGMALNLPTAPAGGQSRGGNRSYF